MYILHHINNLIQQFFDKDFFTSENEDMKYIGSKKERIYLYHSFLCVFQGKGKNYILI
jgi:hypothetical protein